MLPPRLDWRLHPCRAISSLSSERGIQLASRVDVTERASAGRTGHPSLCFQMISPSSESPAQQTQPWDGWD